MCFRPIEQFPVTLRELRLEKECLQRTRSQRFQIQEIFKGYEKSQCLLKKHDQSINKLKAQLLQLKSKNTDNKPSEYFNQVNFMVKITEYEQTIQILMQREQQIRLQALGSISKLQNQKGRLQEQLIALKKQNSLFNNLSTQYLKCIEDKQLKKQMQKVTELSRTAQLQKYIAQLQKKNLYLVELLEQSQRILKQSPSGSKGNCNKQLQNQLDKTRRQLLACQLKNKMLEQHLRSEIAQLKSTITGLQSYNSQLKLFQQKAKFTCKQGHHIQIALTKKRRDQATRVNQMFAEFTRQYQTCTTQIVQM